MKNLKSSRKHKLLDPVQGKAEYSQWEKGGESYRIECAALFAELPPETGLPCDFAHIHAEPVFADDGQ